jgi:hypothetical protein
MMGLQNTYYALSLCLVFAGCAAQRNTPSVNSGLGASSCAQWTTEHAAKSAQAAIQDEWMFDFLRSNDLRLEVKDAWQQGVYSKFYVVWATGLTCEEHPRWTIHELAARFVKNAKQTMLEGVT